MSRGSKTGRGVLAEAQLTSMLPHSVASSELCAGRVRDVGIGLDVVSADLVDGVVAK